MADSKRKPKLAGQRVAFAGRWASLPRAQAETLVADHGGECDAVVTPSTSLLVVGAGGWPLRKDGKPSKNLQRAEALRRDGGAIEILREQDFLDRLGLREAANRARRLLSVSELCELLKISGSRIRAWVRAGLVSPAETQQGVSYFDFQQVAGVKALSKLAERGVRPERLKRTLRRLRAWAPNVEEPLARLDAREFGGRLLVRHDDGQLADAHGQLYMDFDEAAEPAILLLPTGPRNPEDWFRRGCSLEEAGHLQDAADAYRQAALAGGPSAEVCFNLGNVLHGLGRKAEAAERLRQAVELQPAFAEAWNNLGIALGELGEREEAVAAFGRAADADPAYADPHYNLADLLQQMGRTEQARLHWERYLRFDRQSAWGQHAQRQLARGCVPARKTR